MEKVEVSRIDKRKMIKCQAKVEEEGKIKRGKIMWIAKQKYEVGVKRRKKEITFQDRGKWI